MNFLVSHPPPPTVLSAVAMINQSVDSGQFSKTAELLLQQDACLADVEQDSSYHQRYQDQLLAIKRAKAKVCSLILFQGCRNSGFSIFWVSNRCESIRYDKNERERKKHE